MPYVFFLKNLLLIDIIVQLEFPSVHLLEFQLLLLQLCCSCLWEYFSISFLFSPWKKHSCSRAKGKNTLKILFSSNFWQHVCFQLVILFSYENSGAVGTWVECVCVPLSSCGWNQNCWAWAETLCYYLFSSCRNVTC